MLSTSADTHTRKSILTCMKYVRQALISYSLNLGGKVEYKFKQENLE